MNFAIIGASGNVGRKTIAILEKSKISFDNLFLVASSISSAIELVARTLMSKATIARQRSVIRHVF